MKQCIGCGQTVDDSYGFCSACGAQAANLGSAEEPIMREGKAQGGRVQEQAKDAEKSFVVENAVTPVKERSTDLLPDDAQSGSIKTPTSPFSFQNTGLGLVVAALLLAASAAGFYFSAGFNLPIMHKVLDVFGVYALVAFSVVLTMRAKGPDLSAGAVVSASAVICGLLLSRFGSVLSAVLLTVLICTVFGLVNGALASFLKLPSVLLTFLTGLTGRAVISMLTAGALARKPAPVVILPYGTLILIGAVLLPAFLIVLLSPLGIPRYKKETKSARSIVMLVYMLSALFASLAGILLLMSEKMGDAGLAGSLNSEFFIVFVFAMLVSSRALDNRLAPVLFALVPALIWTLGSFVLDQLWIEAYVHPVIYGGFALVVFVIAYACRYERRGKNKMMPCLTVSR